MTEPTEADRVELARQEALAPQRLGEARTAEAVDRIHGRERGERAELRAMADMRRQTDALLAGRRVSRPVEFIVLESVDDVWLATDPATPTAHTTEGAR